MDCHPIAHTFPALSPERLNDLAESIKQDGLLYPIITYQGQILDGRNRFLACQKVGVEPRFQEFPGGNPFKYVWAVNGERRDITADQRYLIWKRIEEGSSAWEQTQAEIRAEANRKRAEAQKGIPKAIIAERISTNSANTLPKTGHEKGQTSKAIASKTNRGAVARGDYLEKKRPDLAEKVISGEINMAAAIRETKRIEIIETLESVEVKEAKAVEGVFDVIVIDPPWPMEKIERDCRPNQTQFDYPVMSINDLEQLEIPTADDCHVWVWTTHKFLPDAIRLIDIWGLKYVCTFTWHKPGGFQPIGLPQYNCEFALYARKGSPVFVDTKAFPVCFSAQRGKHSEKPEEFYDIVRRVTAGRRLDMFNRRVINDFEGWGKESA